MKKLFVADFEDGTLLKEVKTVEDGKKVIMQLVTEDKSRGYNTEDVYKVVPEDYCIYTIESVYGDDAEDLVKFETYEEALKEACRRNDNDRRGYDEFLIGKDTFTNEGFETESLDSVYVMPNDVEIFADVRSVVRAKIVSYIPEVGDDTDNGTCIEVKKIDDYRFPYDIYHKGPNYSGNERFYDCYRVDYIWDDEDEDKNTEYYLIRNAYMA